MSTRTFELDREQVFGREVPLPPQWARWVTSFTLLLVMWWAFVNYGVLGIENFVGPIATFTALVGYLGGEPVIPSGASIYYHAFYSTYRVVVGVMVAALLGIPLGLLIGTSQEWGNYLFPAFESLRAIPPVAWIPVSVLLFPTFSFTGLSINTAVLFVVFVGAFFPILVNTTEGVRNVESDYRRAARSLGANSRQIFRHVIFPAAVSSILTGVTLGIGLGWITVVAAEIIAGNYGLGYIIFRGYRLLQFDVIAVGMVVVGALGYASSAIVLWFTNRAMPWNEIKTNR